VNPLDKIDAARAADAAILGLPESCPLQPGVRFEMQSNASWHDASGEQHEHRLRLLCESIAVKPNGVDYRVVEVLREQDAPPPHVRVVPESGGIAHFAIPLYIESGSLLILGPS
jgi:hypothetical protein